MNTGDVNVNVQLKTYNNEEDRIYRDQGAKIEPSNTKRNIETRTLCHERPVAYPGEYIIIISTVIQVGRAKKRIAVPVVIVGSRTIL